MRHRKLKRQVKISKDKKREKNLNSLEEALERVATNSSTRFTAAAHKSAFIRKDIRLDESCPTATGKQATAVVTGFLYMRI